MGRQPSSRTLRQEAAASTSLAAGEQVDPETGEVTMMTEDEIEAQLAAAAEANAEFFNVQVTTADVVKQVTVPVLSLPFNVPVYLQITEPMHVGPDLRGRVAGYKMAPATITVIKGIRGGLRTLICPAVLQGELERQYPEDAYVGRWFAIKRFPPDVKLAPDKRYSTFQIVEIRDPTAPPSAGAIGTEKQAAE